MLPRSTLLATVLAFAACKPAENAQAAPKPSPTAAPSQGASSASGLNRLEPGTVVASWGDQKLTYGELMEKRGAQFKKLYNKYLTDLHQAEQREVEGYAVEQIVTAAAKKAGKTEDEFLRGLAPADQAISDAEIQAFYDQQVKQSGQPLEAVKERIRGFLAGNKQREQVRAMVDKMKADSGFKMSLPAPEIAKVSFDLAGHPSMGPENAKATLVVFSDFQCPYCSRAAPQVEALAKQFPNDLRVVFFHFPLSFHEKAMPAAIAAQCANAQGKFWEYHDKMFANQASLSPPSFSTWAKELGLDEAKFSACIADPATKAFVDKDFEAGNNAGVEGTPSFYLNGTPTASGLPTPEQIKALL